MSCFSNTVRRAVSVLPLLTLACDAPESGSVAEMGSDANADGVGDALGCSPDIISPLGQTSEQLAPGISGSTAVDDLDALTELELQQIFAAGKLHGLVSSGEDAASVLRRVDGRQIDLIEFELSGLDDFYLADWVSFHVEGEELGALFVADSSEILALVRAGNVEGCAAGESGPEIDREFECSFETPMALDSTTETLSQWAVDTVALTSDELENLPEVHARQLVSTLRHLGLIEDGAEPAAAFAIANASDVELVDLEIVQGDAALDADWISLQIRGKEVGVVFEGGTTTILGEVIAGRVKGCLAAD